jgi:hypothetical protein
MYTLEEVQKKLMYAGFRGTFKLVEEKVWSPNSPNGYYEHKFFELSADTGKGLVRENYQLHLALNDPQSTIWEAIRIGLIDPKYATAPPTDPAAPETLVEPKKVPTMAITSSGKTVSYYHGTAAGDKADIGTITIQDGVKYIKQPYPRVGLADRLDGWVVIP